MNAKTVLYFVAQFFIFCPSQGQNFSNTEKSCIENYQELKTHLRSNHTENVQRMLDAFYPPNKSPSHVVFVKYCVRNNNTIGSETADPAMGQCNEIYTEFQFQWITNTIPLLIDSDVFKANTFNFADLVQVNLTLIIDSPFCDYGGSLIMLETLTQWVSA